MPLEISGPSQAALSATYERLDTPTLRRRHLPRIGDALEVKTADVTIAWDTVTAITGSNQVGIKRIGNVSGADMDVAGDPTFLIGGAPGLSANPASPSNRVRSYQIPGGEDTSTRYVPTMRTETNAQVVEFIFITPGTTFDYNLSIDGRPVVRNGSHVTTVGSTRFLRLTFPTAPGTHHLIDLTVNDPDFFALKMPTGYQAWRPALTFGRRLFVDGDSMVRGSGITPNQSWIYDLGKMLGCDDVWCMAVGGTFYTGGTATNASIETRVANNLAPRVRADDIVMLVGARNSPDTTATTTAATTAINALAVVKQLYVAGTFTVLPQNTRTQAAATATGRPFLDISGLITAANTALYISDGTHKNALGHAYAARMINDLLRATLPY